MRGCVASIGDGLFSLGSHEGVEGPSLGAKAEAYAFEEVPEFICFPLRVVDTGGAFVVDGDEVIGGVTGDSPRVGTTGEYLGFGCCGGHMCDSRNTKENPRVQRGEEGLTDGVDVIGEGESLSFVEACDLTMRQPCLRAVAAYGPTPVGVCVAVFRRSEATDVGARHICMRVTSVKNPCVQQG